MNVRSDDPGESSAARWTVVPPARDEAEARERHDANRASWNEAAAWYTAKNDDRIAELRDGKSNLHPIEREMLGDVRAWCDVAIHLQCASGRDTLSLWLEGAKRVVGIDISEVHIENARRTSDALGAPAEWYRCDVLDAPHRLDGTADLVYTGRGAINWIHDIRAWAGVVARLLKPGGVVSVFDNHPVIYFFDPEASELRLIATDYFDYNDTSQGWAEGYIGNDLGVPLSEQAPKYERVWAPSAVFNALTSVGLIVERFGEHPDDYFPAFPHVPPEQSATIPHTFSMLARKPR